MLFYFHGGDMSLWMFLIWFVLIPILIVCAAIFLQGEYRSNSESYKSNPLSLNEQSDEEKK